MAPGGRLEIYAMIFLLIYFFSHLDHMLYFDLAKAYHAFEGRNCEARALSVDSNYLLLG